MQVAQQSRRLQHLASGLTHPVRFTTAAAEDDAGVVSEGDTRDKQAND